MNWDWDKLQEKRQRQQSWRPAGRSERDEDAGQDKARADGERAGGKDRGGSDGDAGGFRFLTGRKGGGAGKGSSGSPGDSGGSGNDGDPRKFVASFSMPGAKWLALGVVGVWLASGIYIVQPDEAGVVLRFGAYDRSVDPGPHYHLPWPIEEVYRPKVTQVRQAEVGYRSRSSGGVFQQGQVQAVDEEAAMLTGDENVVNVQFNIQYHIKPGDGAVDYLFNVTQPDAVVKKAAEAAMREVIGKTTLEAALTEGRVKVQGEVTELLQDILDRYRVGVQVVAVQMQAVHPPSEVSEAFKDVASAREDKQRLANEAEAYRRDILPRAQGDAVEIRNKAEAYKQTRINNAQGEARRFLSVLKEYEKAEDVTKKRMLYETMEEIMSRPGMDKLVLPSDAASRVLPLLPLGETFSGTDRLLPQGAPAPAASGRPSSFSEPASPLSSSSAPAGASAGNTSDRNGQTAPRFSRQDGSAYRGAM